MDHWAAYLRGQADALRLPVIDTSQLTVDDAADQLEAIVRRLANSDAPMAHEAFVSRTRHALRARSEGRPDEAAAELRALLQDLAPAAKASVTRMNRTDLASAIAAVSTLSGQFTLRSGWTATEYFDKYRFEGDPRLLRAIAEHLEPLIPAGTDVLAGLELGGVPLATALSLRTGLPAVFVRKQAKEYGTRQLAEGGAVTGRRLLVVEDVVTSGGQVVASSEALRALGAVVTHAICVIDREAGGVSALYHVGVELRSLFSKSDLGASSIAQPGGQSARG
jgi:orotate phosphoribosyltransferase